MECLLESDWIPVRSRDGVTVQRIGLRQLLTEDHPWSVSLSRDDMEVAAIQLLICLVQTILLPENRKVLRERVASPITSECFDSAAASYLDWFRLDHPATPFMQSRGVSAKDPTPIQKLFVGLPEGNNHAFFNDAGEIHAVCPGCAAIALFNQASNCPSFGGGFKGGLRGGAPVTTLVAGADLRETVWLNVLSAEERDRIYRDATQFIPNWVEPLVAGKMIPAADIGLERGLLWQPARLELAESEEGQSCDACGLPTSRVYTAFNKEKFNYTVEGLWHHPHSPRLWDLKKGERARDRYLSFTTMAPAWTWMNHYLLQREQHAGGGRQPAQVVTQFLDVFERALSARERRFAMIVAGYRVNQAAVLERRHELYSLPMDWRISERQVQRAIDEALRVKDELRRKTYGFAKECGAAVYPLAEQHFYQATGHRLHELLRQMDRREARVAVDEFIHALHQIARRLFDELTAPYRHSVEGMTAYAKFRRALDVALRESESKEKVA
ncbi:type I-E CRISPR-associated protein Cse1/CasA [Ectothiorhodospira shaposhnikovii]|uniref:type I-E CRISPR-associated protein Cse1/CasA n=1 Tax=Ectothiorhodospira shaposhnikovii TaxID=1054 RepID=UPI00190530C9|nr:type I-E CRISPR-associated protein Cse1/CasA [Ectothiorhodospira shaposhnikovii]MBK1672409.1 type I-E CRISPR-associated protein Cse1/CasA [Ectothiorhodospira shaposhnikovii]